MGIEPKESKKHIRDEKKGMPSSRCYHRCRVREKKKTEATMLIK